MIAVKNQKNNIKTQIRVNGQNNMTNDGDNIIYNNNAVVSHVCSFKV